MASIPPRIEKIAELHLPPMDRLLDIGCGNGEYAFLFKKAFKIKELYGVDMERNGGKAKGIKIVRANLNVSGLPYKDNFFDMVFAGEIVEHILRPDGIFAEMRRVLKPNGYCVITVPNIANWHDRFLLLGGWQPYSITIPSKYRQAGAFWSRSRNIKVKDERYVNVSSNCGLAHVQFLTYKAVKTFTEMHGFKVVKTFGYPSEQFTLNMNRLARAFIISVDRMIARCSASWATGVVIVARKRVEDG